MEKIKNLIIKYRSFIFYGIFGVFTTIVNIVTYNICYYRIEISNTFSNVVAWVLAVTFAYLTNKAWVFESKSWRWRIIKKEIAAFVSCRLATGILDLIIMYVCVDIMGMQAMIMKFASNVLAQRRRMYWNRPF